MQENYVPNIPWLAGHVTVALFPSGKVGFSVSTRQDFRDSLWLRKSQTWWRVVLILLVTDQVCRTVMKTSTWGPAEQKWENCIRAMKQTGPFPLWGPSDFKYRFSVLTLKVGKQPVEADIFKVPDFRNSNWGLYGWCFRNLNYLNFLNRRGCFRWPEEHSLR